MNDVQTRTERMAETCVQYLDNPDFGGILSGDPLLTARRNRLEAQLLIINDIELKQALNNTGPAEQKKNYKAVMAQKAFTVGRKLVLWAIDTNNSTLQAECNYGFYQLSNVKDSTAFDRCRTIYNRANALVLSPPAGPPAFADYSITAPLTAALNTAITNFDNSLGSPGAAHAVTQAATDDLDHAFEDLDTVLTECGHAVDVYRFGTAPEKTFWEGWKAARKRDDSGVRHQSARIYLVDETTLAKIGQGTVALPALNLLKDVTKFSLATFMDAETGIGTYDFIAKANLYEDQPLTNVVIKPEELTKIVVKMKKLQGHPIIN